jgi:hypothetical protein
VKRVECMAGNSTLTSLASMAGMVHVEISVVKAVRGASNFGDASTS